MKPFQQMIGRLPVQHLSGEAFWVGFGLTSSVIALLLGTRFLTGLLSTAEYGRLALAISFATLAMQICGNPIGMTVVRFYSQWHQADKNKEFVHIIGMFTGFSLGSIFLIFIIISLSVFFLNTAYSLQINLLVLFFSAFLILNRIGNGFEDATRKRRFRGILQGGFEAGRFFLAIGMVWLLAIPVAETVLWGFTIAALITVFFHGLFLINLYRQDKNFDPGKKQSIMLETDRHILTKYTLPLIISNGCIWLVMMTERWALKYYGSLDDVGGYAAIYQLAFLPMLFLSNFLVLFTEPILYQLINIKDQTGKVSRALAINRYLALFILLLTLVFFVIFLFFYPVLGDYLLGIQFRQYSWLFPWLLLAGGCFAAAQQFLLKLTCEMRTGTIALLWTIVAVTAIIAYIIGACYWQLTGILTAVVLVNASLLLFTIIFMGQINPDL